MSRMPGPMGRYRSTWPAQALSHTNPDMKEGRRMPVLPDEKRSTGKGTAGNATGLTARPRARAGEA
jgi:hypothetical protein